ncbi:D-arabinono-1,4-lactone oxidase [Candidatus Babela massiliensis]|uniref:FAD/FMN-containing dehydrogenase n=1 Tax=Candidatus Babela massiliensis TaxID=673862 RepID=V6DF28_9BACT|nr:D-arabinono-1,4-lactone oxidase [Candidatus Babela massiliensis]CDK30159.1 FAD/FMN-containing dehydrogenase [Candidatus Babela massiliensis]
MHIKKILALLCVFNCFYILTQDDWSVWGDNPVLYPKDVFYPNNLEEVISIIKKANLDNHKVKAIGSCHSWSNLINTNGYIINTDKLDKILYVDRDNKKVKVECGIKLKDLFSFLAQENLSLPNQGFIAEQSIVGAISTGTHGTGHTGVLSDFISEFEVIDSQGNFYKVTKDTNSDWIPFLRIGLGALSFIYSVTIECDNLFILNHKRVLSTWQEAMDNYKSNYQNNDYYMFMAHPTSDMVLNFFWNKTDSVTKRRFIYDIPENIVTNAFLSRAAVRSLKYAPQVGSRLIELWLFGMQKDSHNQYSYLSLSPLKDPISVEYYIEVEFGVHIDDFKIAIDKFKELYNSYENQGYNLTALLTCRFSPGFDKSFLSMSYKRDTAYITINIINYFDKYLEFFNKLEQMLEPYLPRPHWGKFHLLNKEKICNLYGQETFDRFNDIRDKLDPNRMFSNDFIERCFG